MSEWVLRHVPFKFQLSDWTIWSIPLSLQCRAVALLGEPSGPELPVPPAQELIAGSQGFLIHSLPVTSTLPKLSKRAGYLCYVPLQYEHCYIDLTLTFADYQSKFSSKTRSTINRKVRKYAEHCGGSIPWKVYKTPAEMHEFFRLARSVSKLTYQERLLDVGLPEDEAFVLQAEARAAEDCLRAYILFDGERAVSYLFCPVENDVLIYAYLGYDPEYMKQSVGTVLQWLALEALYGEKRFKAFDFTEGQSEHKRLFATHRRQCANVFLVKASRCNKAVIYAHLLTNRFSHWLGTISEKLGVKARIRKLIRFRR